MTGEPHQHSAQHPAQLPAVGPPQIPDAEHLARFVFRREHVRANGEVKQDAFIPHPYLDCSVTRHASLTAPQIWERGEAVSAQREIPLLGRADVQSAAVRGAGLEPQPDPTPENPEHAVIVGWPSGKPNQKHQAQLIARAAVYSVKP